MSFNGPSQTTWGSPYQGTGEASAVEWKGGMCRTNDQATLETFLQLGGSGIVL